MVNALIAYATKMSQTRKIAEFIAQGIGSENVDVTLYNLSNLGLKPINPQEFDIIVLGSSTYHGEMLQSMKTFLFSIENAGLEGKVGGAFGAYGWSGEAPGRIFNTMRNVFRMKMVNGPLMLQSVREPDGAKMALNYGKGIAGRAAGLL